MKHLIAIIALLVLNTSTSYAKVKPEKTDFSEAVSQLEAQMMKQPLAAPSLDFGDWLDASLSDSRASLSTIATWQKRLATLSPQSVCEQLRYDNIQLTINLMHTRSKLLNSMPKNAQYTGVMSELPNGKQWYRHWLNAWLMLNHQATPDEKAIDMLKAMAEQEIQQAYSEYIAIDATLSTVRPNAYARGDDAQIIKAFRGKERGVYQHLASVFGPLPAIPKVNIEESSLPESFPAPGVYSGPSETFYYHFTEQKLPAESLDWLYLHEAVPGHHMQRHVSLNAALCATSEVLPLPLVSIEGWAAFIETLGSELGLYQSPHSLHYALQWRVLRALRVLIDIGVHYENWTDKQALDLWRRYLPQQMHIGQRELARIKRWPVQVITYVYGKYHIEQLFNHLTLNGFKGQEVAIRNTILRLSNHPPLSRQAVSHFITRSNPL